MIVCNVCKFIVSCSMITMICSWTDPYLLAVRPAYGMEGARLFGAVPDHGGFSYCVEVTSLFCADHTDLFGGQGWGYPFLQCRFRPLARERSTGQK